MSLCWSIRLRFRLRAIRFETNETAQEEEATEKAALTVLAQTVCHPCVLIC